MPALAQDRLRANQAILPLPLLQAADEPDDDGVHRELERRR